MIEISAVLDAYINANILLVLGLVLWMCACSVMGRTRLKPAYLTQLRLLNGAFLAILACPVVALLYAFAVRHGVIPAGYSVNFSDLVVAQYLEGRVALTPSEFESALSLRETLTANLLAYELPLVQAAGALFAVIALSIAGRTVAGVVNLRRLIRKSYPWRRIGRVEIRLSDSVQVPFSTRGLRTRYIVIPSSMLTRTADLKVALAHEFHHLRHSDIEWEIGLEAIKPFFFWNPAFHSWKRNVEHLRELACDQEVLSRNRFDPRAYGECILRVCRASLLKDRRDTVMMPQVALVQAGGTLLRRKGDRFLRSRFNSILSPEPQRPSSRFAAWMVTPLVAAILLAGISIQKPGDWSHDRLMLSTIVNLERMNAINGLGQR